jgi:hypothetical protein
MNKINVVELNSKRYHQWFHIPCPFCKTPYDIYVTLEVTTKQPAPCPNCEKGKELEVILKIEEDQSSSL